MLNLGRLTRRCRHCRQRKGLTVLEISAKCFNNLTSTKEAVVHWLRRSSLLCSHNFTFWSFLSSSSPRCTLALLSSRSLLLLSHSFDLMASPTQTPSAILMVLTSSMKGVILSTPTLLKTSLLSPTSKAATMMLQMSYSLLPKIPPVKQSFFAARSPPVPTTRTSFQHVPS